MTGDPHALLRHLLAKGEISQAAFDQLTSTSPPQPTAHIGGDNRGNLNAGVQHIGQQTIHNHGADAKPATDPAALRKRYLRKLLADRNRDGLARLVVDEATSQLGLASVYTALLTNGTLPQGTDAATQGQRAPVSAVAMLDAHPRLVLLGDPGGGKSSFVSLVAMCLAGQALGDPAVDLATLTAPLPRGEDPGAEPAQPQP